MRQPTTALARHGGAPTQGGTPLTPEQRGLLFLHHLDADAALYTVPVALELHGPLDRDALARAFSELVRRHPLLGSRIAHHDGEPMLVAREDGGPALELADADDPRTEVLREAERPLDLDTGVARALLVRAAPDHHHLLLVVHHVVFDGDSAVIALEDLRALCNGDELGDKPAPFADYVRGRADEAARRGPELRGFWNERLGGIDGRTPLPFDYPAVSPRTRAARSVPVDFGPELSRTLRDAARRQRTSLFAVLLSAFLLTLARYDPDRRGAVAVPVGTRQDPAFDRTIGYFINMLPMREPVRRDLSASAYARWVQSELSGALDHAALPFPRIVELMSDVDPESGNPFTCPFAFQSWYDEPPREWAGGVRATIVEDVHQKGMGHCNLTLSEQDGRIRGFLKYDTERFEHDTAQTIAGDLVAVAGDLVADPDRPASAVMTAVPVTRTRTDVDRPGTQPESGAPPAPADPAIAHAAVHAAWSELLGGDPADDAQFFESGGDSILAVQLVSRLRRRNIPIAVRHIYQHPVLADLVRFAATNSPRPAPTPTPASPPAARPTASSTTTPAQSFFFDRVRTGRWHWNQSVALDLPRPLDHDRLSLALQAVVLAHPVLSTAFAEGVDGWHAVGQAPLTGQRPQDLLVSCGDDPESGQDGAIARLQRSLDPTAGRNLRALHTGDRLVLVAHHLVVDGVSWRILLDDLDAALTALGRGELPRPQADPGSLVDGLAALAHQAADPAGTEYWHEVARARRECATLLAATPPGREGDTRRAEFTLEGEHATRLLGTVPGMLGMPVHDVLTAAAGLALARWRGCDTVTFDVETHGRPDELSHAVGWLTAVDPVVLTADRTLPPHEHLAAAREHLAAAREVPAGFLAHCYLARDPELAAIPPALVSFNYLGRVDRLGGGEHFRPSGEQVPHDRSPEAERLHPVEIYALANGDGLRVGIGWSPAPEDGVDEHSIAALAGQLRAVLTALAEPARDVAWPLTPQQHGLALDALAHPDRYVEQFEWTWRGPFDLDRFTRAWHTLHRRHAVLRGRVEVEQGRFTAEADVPPDITWHPAERDWASLLAAERAEGVDLTRRPLLRLVVQGDGEEHRIALTFHHALLDGWSVAVLLEQQYEAYLDDADPAVEVESRPDARDYSRWLSALDERPARRHWAEQFAGRAPVTRPGLPAPDGDAGTGTGSRTDRTGGVTRLRDRAASLAVTETNVLQALWAALLWRCSGEPGPADVAFGVTVSGRGVPVPEVERMPGMFVNSLPLVVRVDPDEPFGALAERTRDAALELAVFEWASTGRVHGWSGRPGHLPLFESLLVMENYPSSLTAVGARLTAAGIEVDAPRSVGARTPYPLTLLTHRDEDGLATTIVHDRTRVGDDDAERAAATWRALLTRLAEPSGYAGTVADLVTTLADDELPRVADRPTRQAARTRDWPDGPERDVVTAAFRAVLGVQDVRPGDHFFELGGHSLQAVRLLRELAERGADDLRLDHVLTHPTAAELAHLLRGDRAEAPAGPLVPLRPGEEPVVYLLHPPGGQVACYSELAAHYPREHRLVGVRDLRADEPGPHPHRTVEQLTESYLAALPDHDMPVVLAGFSGGGVLAYELARRLDAEGRAPALLVLVDAAAPTGRSTDAAPEDRFLRQVERFDRDRAPADEGERYLADLDAVARWTRGNGGGDPFALLRDTLRAVEEYEPGPYPGPVAVLRAEETDFGRSGDDAPAEYYRRDGLGWEDHCPRLSVRRVAGNHISLLAGPNAAALAATLAGLVDEHIGVRS